MSNFDPSVSIALRLLPVFTHGTIAEYLKEFGGKSFNRPQALTISATLFIPTPWVTTVKVSIALRLLPLVQRKSGYCTLEKDYVSIALRLLPLVQRRVRRISQDKFGVSIALRLLPLVQPLPQLPNISAQLKAGELPFFRKPIFCIFIPEVCEKMFNSKRPLMSRTNSTLQKLWWKLN